MYLFYFIFVSSLFFFFALLLFLSHLQNVNKMNFFFFHRTHLINKYFFILFSVDWFMQPGSSDLLYPCDSCGRQYRRLISLQRHKRLECGKEAQFQCVICHSKFKHKHSLLRHYRIHLLPNSDDNIKMDSRFADD